MAPKKGAGSKQGGSKKQMSTVPDSDHIIFGDDKKKRRGKDTNQEQSSESSKPTARQVVGGASWTGKLPVNLLSEHCQRQKWNKPDYSMRQIPNRGDGQATFRSEVTLSKTDPKTKQVTKIPPFRLPPSEANLADQPSALEARHFAATYALFRVQSTKSLHMALPPTYRDIWKGDFVQLKKVDTEAGHGWKYDEDPFAAEAKRQEILKSIESRKEEDKRKQESLVKDGASGSAPHGSQDSKNWDRMPHIEMGQQIRIDIEQLIRQYSVWNRRQSSLSKQQQIRVVKDITELGFRQSHVEEALEYCQEQQEILEWLLVHVPEDDLPRWTFPSSYSAGVTLASRDLIKDLKMKALASAGYSSDLCIQALRISEGDENLAALNLQASLVPSLQDLKPQDTDSSPAWTEEMQTLGAIFGENFQSTKFQCIVTMSTVNEMPFKVHARCPMKGYPYTAIPAISIEINDVPAYIRLSATKRVVQYAQFELMGEVMIYSICQWLEAELPNVIDNPGRLSELHMLSPDFSTVGKTIEDRKGKQALKVPHRPRFRSNHNQDKRSNADILMAWKIRQQTAEQVLMTEARQKLPAWAKRDEITETVQKCQVTVISGETGSGKSTQTVQFILDDAISQGTGSQVNILCTQPRRVATISLADRVASERCSSVGDEVGYVIRGESKVSNQTKITFMTTGVLLRRLQSSPSMKEALAAVSHIVVDEVHERSLDTDFLLALLRNCIKEQHRVKIILMSATLDANIFITYFGGVNQVKLVNIKGRAFPVQDIYLEDILPAVNLQAKMGDIGKAIQALGVGINYDLIRDIVQHIEENMHGQSGAILIFLPGTAEIERCLRAVADLPGVLGLPLHASLLPSEQRKVFPPSPAGRRKIVAATNVAETSITIEDVVAVIDTGRVKETKYDAVNNIVRLEEVWASQAACIQRRGRAGRVREGTCYKLFTRSVESKMSPKNVPEIQRVSLEQLCLSVKATVVDHDVKDFLSETLTPPDSEAVTNAVRALHTMGALENDRLTTLGTYLTMVPVDLRCAKLLVYGALFDCLEACLTIASVLTVKSPFVSPRDKKEEANEARLTFSNAHGDLMVDLATYDEWNALSQNLPQRDIRDWCSRKYVSLQTLRDISSTRRQILDSLKEAGLVPLSYRSNSQAEKHVEVVQDALLLRALIAAALQPQLALISFPSKKYISSVSGAKELDPEAKTIKFFIPGESVNLDGATEHQSGPASGRTDTPKANALSRTDEGHTELKQKLPPLTRVFIHPSSTLFSAQTFSGHATHMSYFTKMMTSKPFIRDLTPLNIYSLLLFGGRLELDTTGQGLTVGNAWKVRGWARIGVLVSRLRVLLDEELQRKVDDGGILLGSMSNSRVVGTVKRLIVYNGQDQ